MDQTSLFLPFLRHITQIQIDVIINVSFMDQNVEFYCNKKKANPSQSTCILSSLSFP